MLFFAGVLVGQRGGVICVEVEENSRVGILRRALIDEVNRDDEEKRIRCPADNVDLYLAKVDDSCWLRTDDDRAKRLNAGRVPDDIESILSSEPLDPTSFVNDICSGPTPQKTIQILIVTPSSSLHVENARKRTAGVDLEAPRKAAKTEVIQEKTEESEQNQHNGATPRTKSKKDKGDYQVGDLASFSSKIKKLHSTASELNNYKLIAMMMELFRETVVYRSDVERSGLAAVIALLRKSSNPMVAQTATSLRKHMIKILNNDF